MLEKRIFHFSSTEGKAQIQGILWFDAAAYESQGGKPKAFVQLVHGMTEHMNRYEDFAAFLCENGYVVCGHDHFGHGGSVVSPDDWGYIPSKGGVNILVEDVQLAYESAVKEASSIFPGECVENLPHFILGHSMGSFVVRNYLACYGKDLQGGIISGTATQPQFVAEAGAALARFRAKCKGDRYFSNLLNNLAVGSYAKAVPNAKTDFDWLSTDESVVEAYVADPACGFAFKAGAYATLLGLICKMQDEDTIEDTPHDLPLLFIAGDKDPVGNNGEGVKLAVSLYKKAQFSDVSLKLYEGFRHETLNEIGKERVYADVLAWIKEHE